MTALIAGCIALVMMASSSIQAVNGTASWYDNGPGLYAAAGPALRVGDWRGRTVTVCADSCVTLKLVDWCACPHRVIDLSADAFRQLAPLSRGLVHVVVSWGTPPLPATDTGIAPDPSDGALSLPVNMGGHSMRQF